MTPAQRDRLAGELVRLIQHIERGAGDAAFEEAAAFIANLAAASGTHRPKIITDDDIQRALGTF